MRNFHQQKVLITGGASGIGKIMSGLFLDYGARVIIWDIDPIAIKAIVDEFAQRGEIHGYSVDIADQTKVQRAFEKVKANHGVIDVLINNAGIVVGKYFHEHTELDIRRTMDINALAPMYITSLFLPDMIAQNNGSICNIASSASYISNPKMSVYVASKWSIFGWSDSLRIEMKLLQKNIRVTTVTPYYINTGMFDGVRSLVPILRPEKVAKKILRGIASGKPIVSMPWSIHFVRFFQGIFPIRFFDWFVGGVLGIYKTMDNFKGRQNT
ncbi:SDR family oxidoreductase [Sphingobacterium corticibacter]|uniref:Short-chain dehydrogenase n=1 Tax=Sphingobacterium corticibacter TaxID=2171749 RepID=A0A2T8HHE6_9SPHI|nr:SDR family oxidoreductase [Sphingobacterium corticibacter]PVH24854.1 short-chain dehydrogenase [Sphingobacterium corticibacter]